MMDMYHNGLKVFSYHYTGPIPADMFAKNMLGKNMRGYFNDLNIYVRFLPEIPPVANKLVEKYLHGTQVN